MFGTLSSSSRDLGIENLGYF